MNTKVSFLAAILFGVSAAIAQVRPDLTSLMGYASIGVSIFVVLIKAILMANGRPKFGEWLSLAIFIGIAVVLVVWYWPVLSLVTMPAPPTPTPSGVLSG